MTRRQRQSRPPQLLQPSPKIIYVFALPSWEQNAVTPFQGFAPGLLMLGNLLRTPARLPASIDEPAFDVVDRLARRRIGIGSLWWSPVNLETLVRHRKPLPHIPFMIVFTAEEAVAKRVATWRRGLRIRPLHVSSVGGGGRLSPEDLTFESLRQHCRLAVRQAAKSNRQIDAAATLSILDRWKPIPEQPSSLRFHSHNVVLPNQMVLTSLGEALPGEAGRLEVSQHQEYVSGIAESAKSVASAYEAVRYKLQLRLPQQPDLILLAPGTVRGVLQHMRRQTLPTEVKRTLTALDRQRGYTIETQADLTEIDTVGPWLVSRGAELRIQTELVGLRAVSTGAATLRLPPAVNRTTGVVGHLARHLRSHDGKTPKVKTARVFKVVQDALTLAVPDEFHEVIAASRSGIKIISDAPLEWLPVGDLPLGIAHDVSRINTVPGNVMIEQLRSVPPVYIHPETFRGCLVVSMFEETDNDLAHCMLAALSVMKTSDGRAITARRSAPQTVDAFCEAINAYDGPLLVVDSHGEHPLAKDVGGLIIGGVPVDIWSLRGRLRSPPIVVLSACDTHPFDRSHATVANGFLQCGALAVVATALPIRGPDAAVFITRLLLRATEFSAAASASGRPVSWTKVVGGALRMQLASDLVRKLGDEGYLTDERRNQIHLRANMDINPHRADWLNRLARRCRSASGMGSDDWSAFYRDTLAGSDVIRYVHLGNPEAIMLTSDSDLLSLNEYEDRGVPKEMTATPLHT